MTEYKQKGPDMSRISWVVCHLHRISTCGKRSSTCRAQAAQVLMAPLVFLKKSAMNRWKLITVFSLARGLKSVWESLRRWVQACWELTDSTLNPRVKWYCALLREVSSDRLASYREGDATCVLSASETGDRHRLYGPSWLEKKMHTLITLIYLGFSIVFRLHRRGHADRCSGRCCVHFPSTRRHPSSHQDHWLQQ